MFMKFTLGIMTLILFIGLAGCSSNNSQNNASIGTPGTPAPDNYQMLPVISNTVANLKLNASADGTTQILKMGEVMAVTLESNPSTGYSWFASISDEAVLALMGEPEYIGPTQSATPMVGVPGAQTFYFQAADTGSATVTLEYKRGWEKDVAPEKTITITVDVQ